MNYAEFFQQASGISEPYAYQTRLAEGDWPDLLDAPTGMGKTAAVVLAWVYKRKTAVPDTPRRLIYCLPMRVLVEQTQENVKTWLQNLGCYAETSEMQGIAVHSLMGGAEDTRSWVEHPEKAAIIIGTQDMLLSRALMRGYGMSRYRWPVDFALLHNDALWVFDEVQLMGAGLSTTTQLEAFRRSEDMPGSAKSLWMSATLNKDWLKTIDFRPHVQTLTTCGLSTQERQSAAVITRYQAHKKLLRCAVTLDEENNKATTYIKQLGEHIIQQHPTGKVTLVVMNNVKRAQDIYDYLDGYFAEAGSESAPALSLIHACFRQKERTELNAMLRNIKPEDNRIIIATQAIEAGVDLSCYTLYTELAPWSSLVQRFGRCNRAGEHETAQVYWMDIEPDGKGALTLPYTPESLTASRVYLHDLEGQSVAPYNLPPVEESQETHHVLRAKDLLELFNTDPDLSGFDIDISPYVRDQGTPSVQVFWRDFTDDAKDQNRPASAELCPVSIKQIKEHLGKNDIQARRWDTLTRRWEEVKKEQVRPGMTLMLRCADGGYCPQRGFVPRREGVVEAFLPLSEEELVPEEGYADERSNQLGKFISLPDHLSHVAQEVESLCDQVKETEHAAALIMAGRWHDVGKAHPAMQSMFLLGAERLPENACDVMWAKSDRIFEKGAAQKRYPEYVVVKDDNKLIINRKEKHENEESFIACDGSEYSKQKVHHRKYFRHELASALAWLQQGESQADIDLIAYLIAAHHGKVRMGLRALPDETGPADGRRFARGVWEGDYLPAFDFDGETLKEIYLRMEVMELGEGDMGPSWSSRAQRLLQEHGPFRLAWLETLLRIADRRASKKERDDFYE